MGKIGQGKYYPFLDGLRAFAVLWVIFRHLNYELNLNFIFGDYYVFFDRLGYVGFLGVDIFFVISGFLITGLLLPDLDHKIRMKRFYLRRFLKIYPHYIFIVLVGFLISFLLFQERQNNSLTYSSYLIAMQNYVEPVKLLDHLWSISVEEHFYLLYPLILQSVCLLKKNVRYKKKVLFIVLVGLIIFGNFIRYYAMRDFRFGSGSMPYHMLNDTHIRFDALLFGCVIKLLENQLLALKDFFKRFFRSAFFVLGFMIFFSFLFRFRLFGWECYTLAYIATGFIIASALLGHKPLNQILSIPALIWVGKQSYGIYLWHHIILFPILKLVPVIGGGFTVFFYLLSSIILGAFTTGTLERYFLNQRKKWAP